MMTMFDHPLFLIFSFILIGLVIIGISVNAIVGQVLKYKRELNGVAQSGAGPQVTELADRTDLIEDRLRVLERIATDRGQVLADEIEQLRSDRVVSEPQPEPQREPRP